MKINKNVVLEYLYLTIFVITLFVLKELIEYVFFTRKRNNIIEKFSDHDTCGRIEWYYDNHANIKKIFEMFNYSSGELYNMTIPCQNYVEFKTVTDAATENYSRIVLEPSNEAIYFEKFTINGDSIAVVNCVAIKFRPDPTASSSSQIYLDFIKYNYSTLPTFVTANNSYSFDSRNHNELRTFAKFDTTIEYDGNINEVIQRLVSDH